MKILTPLIFLVFIVNGFGAETDLGNGYRVVTNLGIVPHATSNSKLIYKRSFFSKKIIWPSLTIAPGGAAEFVKDDIAIFPAGIPKSEMFGLDAMIGASLHGSKACIITYQLPQLPGDLGMSSDEFARAYSFFGYEQKQEGILVTYDRIAIQSHLPEEYKVLVTWIKLKKVIQQLVEGNEIKVLDGVEYLVPKK